MKKIYNQTGFRRKPAFAAWIAASALLVLVSCKKDEAKIFYTGGTAPVLTASVSDSIHLAPADSTKTAVTFNWTNPNYGFSNGVSSMNVTYYLQIDTVGANFSSKHMQTVSISPDLTISYSVAAFNALLGNGLLLSFGQSHKIQVRIGSFIAPLSSGSAQAAPLYSSTLTYTVTPYAPPPKVNPPASGTLFIVGSATPGGSAHGWDNPISNTPVSQQQFAQISPMEYKITIPLIGNGEYKLIAVNGSWSQQWSTAIQDDPNAIFGGAFVFNGQNVLAPPTSGTYTIDVNFQTGLFTVTP